MIKMTKKLPVILLLFAVMVVALNFFSFPVTASSVTEIGPSALQSNPAAVNADQHFFNLIMGGKAELWNNLLVNDYIDEEMKDNYLQKIEDTGFVVNDDVNIGSSLSLGPVTAFAGGNEQMMVTLPYKAAELLLRGNEDWDLDNYNLDLAGTEGSFSVYGNAGGNLSFALPDSYLESIDLDVDNLYLGFNYHYVTGVIGEVVADGDISIEFDENGYPYIAETENDPWVEVRYNDPQQGDLATGHVLDFGLYTELSDSLALGFSYMNLGSLEVEGIMYYNYPLSAEEETDSGEVDKKYRSEEKLTHKLPSELRGGVRLDRGWYAAYSEFLRRSYPRFSDTQLTVGGIFKYVSWLPLELAGTFSSLRNDIFLEAKTGFSPGPIKTEVKVSDLMGVFNRARSASIGLNFGLEF
ncbi:MAG: hypothetical protein ACOC2G_00845 [Bacillota bacterium]